MASFFSVGRYEQDLEQRKFLHETLARQRQAELAEKERQEEEEIAKNSVHRKAKAFNQKKFNQEYSKKI